MAVFQTEVKPHEVEGTAKGVRSPRAARPNPVQTLTDVLPATSPDDRLRQKRERLAEAQAAIKRAAAKDEQAREVIDRAREQVSRARDNLSRAKAAVEAV